MKEKSIGNEIRRIATMAVLAIVLLGSPLMLSTFASAAPNSGCSVTVTGENVGNTAIQSAINLAEGGSIGPKVCVDGGSYPEQLTIDSSGIQLVGLGTALNPTILNPSALTTQIANDPDNSLPVVAIVLVSGSD